MTGVPPMKIPDTPSIEGLKELLAKATGQTHGIDDRSRPLPWKVWTSCSFRRVKTDHTLDHDGGLDVLSAYRCSDGGLDLSMPEDRLVALVETINALPHLIAALASPPPQPDIEGRAREIFEVRGIVRNALYRNLPIEIDANVCRAVADEILSALPTTAIRREADSMARILEEQAADPARRLSPSKEDGRP